MTMAEAAPVFMYDTLAPLGDAGLESSFLPLEGPGSPSGRNFVAEQATSTVTVERQETKRFRTLKRKRDGAGEERKSETVISAEKDLLTETCNSEHFRVRADTFSSSDLALQSSALHSYSVSRTNLQSTNGAQVEGDVPETEFIPLDLGGGDAEILVQELVQSKRKQVVTMGALSMKPKEAPPWARGRDTWIQSPLLQLHQEIVDFGEFVAPTEEEQQIRATAVQRVSDVVKSIWPSCQVKVFGSFATGLYLPTSDVDVVVLDSGCQARQDGLKALAKGLTRKSVAKSIQVIGKARVPIIKFVETHSNIPFDISFDVANGPEAADFITAAMEAFPPLRPLCLVLKIFLQQRELNEVYQGGIGSYALLVMILTHLQIHPSKRRIGNQAQAQPLESNLGRLLVDFLELYGRSLNMKDVGVSCRSGGRFFSKKDRGFTDSKRPYLLCVEDPQSPDNDIGKNSFAIQKVRSAFMMAYRRLTDMDGDNDVGLLGRIVRLDSKLVGRKVPVSLHPRKADAEPELFVISNSESDDATKLKTPENGRGRWHNDEEDDFPRGHSADGYLLKKARKDKKCKERVRDEDAFAQIAYDRYQCSPSTPQEDPVHSSRKRKRQESAGMDQNSHGKHLSKSKQVSKKTESAGPEEGEVRLGRRARKREEHLKWKAENLQEENDVAPDSRKRRNVARGEKPAARSTGQNQHTHWNDHGEVADSGRSSSAKKLSRFRESPAPQRGSGVHQEGSEVTLRLNQIGGF